MMGQEAVQEQKSIVVETVMARRDYSALRTYFMYKIRPGAIRNLVILLLLSIIVVVLGRAEVYFIPQILHKTGLIVLFALSLLFIIIDSNARKLEKPGKSVRNKTQRVELSEKGFQVEWLNYSIPLDYKWETVIRVAETEEYYFLFVSRLTAIIIPKRGLKEDKLAAIQELIRRKVK